MSSKADICKANLGETYGFGSMSAEFNQELAEKLKTIEDTLRKVADSEKSRDEILQGLKKDLASFYKKKYVAEVQAKVSTAKATVVLLDKARQLAKGKPLTTKHLGSAIKEIFMGEGGSLMFQKKGLFGKLKSEYNSRLLEKKILKKVNSAKDKAEVNEEILRFLHDMSDEVEMENINYLKHFTPEEAQELYKAHRFMQDRIFFEKKQAGLGIGKEKNFITSRRYDLKKLNRLGPDNFVRLMEDAVDHNKTFNTSDLATSAEKRAEYFKKLYDSLIKSENSFTSLESKDISTAISSKLKSRQLAFDKGKSYQVFKELSPITDYSTMVAQDLDEASTTVTNYKFFGPDKEAFKKELLNNIDDFAKGLDVGEPAVKTPFGRKINKGELKGEQIKEIKQNVKKWTGLLEGHYKNEVTALGYVLQGLNNLQVATKLGASFITTSMPTDVVTTTLSVLADRGPLEALKSLGDQAKIYKQLFSTWSEEGIEQFSKDSMLFVDVQSMTYLDRINSDFTSEATGEGFAKAFARKTSQFATTMMKYSAMDFQYKRGYLAGGAQSLITLGGVADGVFDNGYTKLAMESLNFSAAEKEVFGKLKVGVDGIAAGHKMLNIDSIYDEDAIPLEMFGSKSKDINRARRSEMIAKLTGFAHSRAGQSSPTPNLRTSLRGGEKIDNWHVAMKSMLIFKNTIMHMTDVTAGQVQRIYAANGYKGLSQSAALIGSGSLVAYMASEIVASAILDRKSKSLAFIAGERDSVEPFLTDFASKMSLAPILTDPLLREFEQRDRWGQSGIVDSLTGPNISMLRDLANIPKGSDPGKSALRFGMNHLLPGSHFALRGLMSHAFDYDIRGLKEKRDREKFGLPRF